MLKKITILTASAIIAGSINAQVVIDRYTTIQSIETKAQAQPLNVEISIKFAKNIITVKQAINRLLLKSGYKLNPNYESEKINNFELPKVHRELGPIPLKRAIKVLLGSAWELQIDETSRTIQIVQTGVNTLQVLNPSARTLLEAVIKPDVLDEVISVSINNEPIIDALNKILPMGWKVNTESEDEALVGKVVSVVSEDLEREAVIKKILKNADAQGFFYKKLKLLLIRSNTKVIR